MSLIGHTHYNPSLDSPLHSSRSALVVDTKGKNIDYLAPVSSVSTALSGSVVERVHVDNGSQVRNDVHALSSKIDSVLSRARSASPVSIRAHDIHVLESSKYAPLHTSTIPIDTVSTIRKSVVVPRTTVSQITNTQNIKDIVITKPEVKYVHQEPIVQTRYVHQEPVVQTRYVHQEPIVQTKYVEVPKRQEIAIPYRTEYKFVHQHKEPVVQTRAIEIPRTTVLPLHYSSVVSSPVNRLTTYRPEIVSSRVITRPVYEPIYEPVKFVSTTPKFDIRPTVHFAPRVEPVERVETHNCCHAHHCCGHHAESTNSVKRPLRRRQNKRQEEEEENEEEQQEPQENEEAPKKNGARRQDINQERKKRNPQQNEEEEKLSKQKPQAQQKANNNQESDQMPQEDEQEEEQNQNQDEEKKNNFGPGRTKAPKKIVHKSPVQYGSSGDKKAKTEVSDRV